MVEALRANGPILLILLNTLVARGRGHTLHDPDLSLTARGNLLQLG